MNLLKTIRSHFIVLTFISLLVIFTYWSLPNTFFQQDEWQTLAGDIYYINKGSTGIIESFLPTDSLSHFNPLARVFSWFEYVFYYTNFALYAWQSIILHILNTFLLYYFALTWLKNRKIAIFSSIFFGINSIPHQAVTWVAAANSYEIPTAFILLSLIFFQRFSIQEKYRKRNILLSFIMLFISLLFHENGIFLLLFYPIIFFLYAKPGWKNLLPVFSTGILLTIAIFVLIRIPFFFGLSNSLPEVTDISRPPVKVYPYRLISLSLKSFAGSFFPEKTLIHISEEVVKLAYPQFLTSDGISNPFIAQSIVFDLVSYTLTVLIVCLIILYLHFVYDNTLRRALVWSLLFVPFSVLPYVFVLGKAGYASIFEPKFLYITSVGTSVLLATIVYWLIFKSPRLKILTPFMMICFVLYVMFHMYHIKSNIEELEKIGRQRKAFLNTIQSSYSDLPEKVVFFTQSDTAYYGMPAEEKILPIQIGFGKILMIWYQKTEQFPGCFYEEGFLIRMLEQGYRYCDGRGFGYFRNYDALRDAMKSQDIPIENVISFFWSESPKLFLNISSEIREKLWTEIGDMPGSRKF